MELLIYAGMGTIVMIAFIVLVHLNFKAAMNDCQSAWKLAIHAHDDAAARVVQERSWSTAHIKALTEWGNQLVKSHGDLSANIVTSATREIQEVQRYMEVFRQDMMVAVVNAVIEHSRKAPPVSQPIVSVTLPTIPPHINPTVVERPDNMPTTEWSQKSGSK